MQFALLVMIVMALSIHFYWVDFFGYSMFNWFAISAKINDAYVIDVFFR